MVKKKVRPTVGLVLSGGGARALSHVGVLKVLKKNNIPIDFIAGDSMGGFVALVYAATLDVEKVESFARSFDSKKILSLADFSFGNFGIFKGEKFEHMLKDLLRNDDFKKLKIPCVVNATDLRTGKEVIIDKGSIIKAIRATTSIPGVFIPVNKKKRILVDGGLVNALPIHLLKNKADIIIAVDVTKVSYDIKEDLGYTKILERTIRIMEHNLVRNSISQFKPDIIIEPKVQNINIFDFLRIEEKIKAGEVATRKKMKEIKHLIDDES